MTREQLGVCDAVAKHFKITKAKVRAQAELYLEQNGQSPVLEIAGPDSELFLGTSKNSLVLGKMMFFKYLERTDLYSDLVNMFGNYAPEAVAFYSGGALLVVYQAEEYSGSGGVFVRKENARSGYAIEPIAHYLQQNYPIYLEE